jgi:solute carrier family 25, member 34/35
MGEAPQRGLPLAILLGSVASSSAVCFSNPLELIKSRLQLQGELGKRPSGSVVYRGWIHAFTHIIKHEGIRGIQQGIRTAIAFNCGELILVLRSCTVPKLVWC